MEIIVEKSLKGLYMNNEFRKLIRKEFGSSVYHKFSHFLQEKLENGKIDALINSRTNIENDKIYKEMYAILKAKDSSTLKKMQEKLTNTMVTSMGICRSYLFVVLVYLIAMYSCVVLITDLEYMYDAMILLSVICFYKTVEYISNKFCFIDAQLVIVYKTVLDNLLACKDKKINI